MRHLLFAKSAVQAAQLVLLRFGKRPAVGSVSEFQHGFDVARLRIRKRLWRNAAARVRIGWRSGSNLDGSASCVAYCQSCSNASTSAMASRLT